MLRVDSKKGYIDLSKKNINKDAEYQCLDKFAKSKSCNAMLVGISEKTKVSLEDLYNQIIYPLYNDYNHPLEAFSCSINDSSIFDKLKIDTQVRELLSNEIKRRLQP